MKQNPLEQKKPRLFFKQQTKT